MNSLPKDDLDLHEAFEIIMLIEGTPGHSKEISELILVDGLNQRSLKKVLEKHNIGSIEDIKGDTLDLLILYINIILNDHEITSKERLNASLLKRFFKIKEGDFYKLRYYEIEDIIHRQLERMNRLGFITFEDALHRVELQELFDLGYDQFLEFKNKEEERIKYLGLDLVSYESSKLPKLYEISKADEIFYKMKEYIFKRDNGKCRKCGEGNSFELEYVIPLEKGGSKTFRNIQLICDGCLK